LTPDCAQKANCHRAAQAWGRRLGAVVARQHVPALHLVTNMLALYGETPPVPLEGIRYRADQVLGPWFPAAQSLAGRER
jgi:hypothetical protein